MSRSAARVFPVIFLLLLAIFVPLTVSGYSELIKNAARRLSWRADLYEVPGHSYYYAEDYLQANACGLHPC